MTRRVLILEADRDSCEAYERTLKSSGFLTDCARSVGEALMKLEAGPLPDMLVLDLRLPDANGTLLLRRIRRDNLPIKIAVVTGVSDQFMRYDMAKFAPDALFEKPLALSKLVDWAKSVQ